MSTSKAPLRLAVMTASLRKAAHSRSFARSLPALVPDGVEVVDLPSVGDLPLFNQDILDEVGVPESVARLADGVAKAKGIIIVSPEYNWSIPGTLKNALDWLSRLKPNPMVDKPVVIFTCSPGLLGGARAHAPIRNVLHSLDCKILARPEVMVSQIATKIGGDPAVLTDPSTKDFVASRLAAFADFIKGAGAAE